jgi:hypothetical protein
MLCPLDANRYDQLLASQIQHLQPTDGFPTKTVTQREILLRNVITNICS